MAVETRNGSLELCTSNLEVQSSYEMEFLLTIKSSGHAILPACSPCSQARTDVLLFIVSRYDEAHSHESIVPRIAKNV